MQPREGPERGPDGDDHCNPDAGGGHSQRLGAAIVFYVLWGWLGGLFGLVVGYGTGV